MVERWSYAPTANSLVLVRSFAWICYAKPFRCMDFSCVDIVGVTGSIPVAPTTLSITYEPSALLHAASGSIPEARDVSSAHFVAYHILLPSSGWRSLIRMASQSGPLDCTRTASP
jgi:hypothetical protein